MNVADMNLTTVLPFAIVVGLFLVGSLALRKKKKPAMVRDFENEGKQRERERDPLYMDLLGKCGKDKAKANSLYDDIVNNNDPQVAHYKLLRLIHPIDAWVPDHNVWKSNTEYTGKLREEEKP